MNRPKALVRDPETQRCVPKAKLADATRPVCQHGLPKALLQKGESKRIRSTQAKPLEVIALLFAMLSVRMLSVETAVQKLV